MYRWFVVLAGLVLTSALSFPASPPSETELKGAFRRPVNNGWTFVHLQGTPHEIGFQNGYLLKTRWQS
jgi:hypothetical protein